MASKRSLKKDITYICGDLAGECIFAKSALEGIDIDKVDDVICKVALLQVNSIDKVSVSFDKQISSFDGNVKEYNKAKRKYFKTCYAELRKEINESIKGIANDMNALLSPSLREANKAMASK